MTECWVHLQVMSKGLS